MKKIVATTFCLLMFCGLLLTVGINMVVAQDTTPPTGSIVINSGEDYTSSTLVNITLSASDPESGITQMRIRNDEETWPNWIPYVTSMSWNLTQGNGEKKVWVYFMNGDGMVSGIVSDTIILDTTLHIEQHEIFYNQTTYIVETRTNTTLFDFTFNQTLARIRFNATQTDETSGFCNITIPSELMWGTFSIYKDDIALIENTDYTQTSNSTHYIFSLNYEHGSHIIDVFSTDVIPELSALVMISTLVILSIAVVVYRKKNAKKQKN